MNAKETVFEVLGDMQKAEGASEISRRYEPRLRESISREAKVMERIVRDAIVSYLELYSTASGPNIEQEIIERAMTANLWLAAHGFKQETLDFKKEGTSIQCL